MGYAVRNEGERDGECGVPWSLSRIGNRIGARYVREAWAAYARGPVAEVSDLEGADGEDDEADTGNPGTGDIEESGHAADAEESDDADADALEDLADEIAVLSAHISAATYRLLILIARFDERRGWEPGGFRSCADWLAFRTGVCKGAAREKVRTARALGALPSTSAAMERGELSFAKVRAITRAGTPENEDALVELAHATTAEELERVIRSWRRHDRATEAEIERALHRSRRLVIRPDGEGMYEVRGRLDPEVGALLMRAIEAASDALWRAATDPYDTSAEQRRADAIALLAERALAAGFGGGRRGEDGAAEEEEAMTVDQGAAEGEEEAAAADGPDEIEAAEAREAAAPAQAGPPAGVSAETSGGAEPAAEGVDERATAERVASRAGRVSAETSAGRRPAPISGSRAERYQVLLLVEPATLAAEGEPGRSELEDGTRVSAETARRLACDASVVKITAAPRTDGRAQVDVGQVLDVGRRTRTIPPALRRALDTRDRGCRFPGCGLRFTDGHHIRHWQDGGPTALHNLVSLCAFHHRLVHEEGFRVELPPGGRPNFYTPTGMPLPEVPPPAAGSAARGLAGSGLSGRGEEAAGDAAPGEDAPGDATSDATARPQDLQLADRLLHMQLRRGIQPRWDTGRARYRHARDIPLSVLLPAMEAAAERRG